MSIGFCGMMEMNKWSASKSIQIAYKLIEISLLVHCGIKMGGNVSSEVNKIYKRFMDKDVLLFEITDTPLDNFAEDIFQPCINQMGMDYEDEFENKIKTSLKKVESLLRTMLEFGVVKAVYVDLNYQFKNEKRYEVMLIDHFFDYVLNEYKRNNYFAPTISLKLVNKLEGPEKR